MNHRTQTTDREQMETGLSGATVLVPFDASDPGSPSGDLVELLGPHSVVALGYYPVPDQSTTEQLESQFGEEARETTESIAEQFADRGADVTTVVVFTHDRSTTIERVATEYEADAVLTTGLVEGTLDRVLVPLRGDDNLEQIVKFVSVLLRQSTAEVTVLNVAESDDDAAQGELIVRGACDRLEEAGLGSDRVGWRQERSGDVSSTIESVAEGYDMMMLGETEPSLRERIIGGITLDLIDQSPKPVLIIRNQ